jgi:threonine/homoserine/homoserine lactone efflux protein
MGTSFPTRKPCARRDDDHHNGDVPTTNQWLAFVVASALFIQVPGPSLLFTIGRALTVGRRDALLSVLRNALGVTTQVFLVAVGLGAVVAASAEAYTVLKIVGAAYVVWLGIQAIRHRADARAALGAVDHLQIAPATTLHSLRVGFTVGLTNPKTIVFFVAFLPQFIDPHAAVYRQLWVLAITFVVLATLNATMYAVFASTAARLLASPRAQRRFNVAGGSLLSIAGAWALLARHPA